MPQNQFGGPSGKKSKLPLGWQFAEKAVKATKKANDKMTDMEKAARWQGHGKPLQDLEDFTDTGVMKKYGGDGGPGPASKKAPITKKVKKR